MGTREKKDKRGEENEKLWGYLVTLMGPLTGLKSILFDWGINAIPKGRADENVIIIESRGCQ